METFAKENYSLIGVSCMFNIPSDLVYLSLQFQIMLYHLWAFCKKISQASEVQLGDGVFISFLKSHLNSVFTF